METTCFEDLPQDCVRRVLESCGVRELVAFQGVSRWCRALARHPDLLGGKLLTYGIHVARGDKAPSYDDIVDVHKAVGERSGLERLNFRGLMTDGGIQKYPRVFPWQVWVDNMFKDDDHVCYCSDLNVHDSRCIAVFIDQEKVLYVDLALEPACIPTQKPLIVNQHLLEVLMTQGDQACPHDEEDRVLIPVTNSIVVGRLGVMSCPVSSGVVFLGTNFEYFKGDQKEAVASLYSPAQSDLAEAFSGCPDLKALLDAAEKGDIPRPLCVTWGVNGEWVEFQRSSGFGGSSFHPAVWFKFNSESEFLPNGDEESVMVETERRSRLADRCNGLGIPCKSLYPPAVSCPGTDLRTNATAFKTYCSCPACDDGILTGRLCMEMNLTNPCAGNCACVILITYEDLINRRFISGPNLDMNFVHMFGKQVPIPRKHLGIVEKFKETTLG